jgi:hypothetical protein
MSLFDELFGTNSFPPSGEVSEADALTNRAESADSESSQMKDKEEDCMTSQKRKRCDSTDASDDSDSAFPSSCGNKKHRGKVIKLKDEHLDLQCEWRDCDYRTCNLDHFVRHVSLNIPHPEVKVNEDLEGTGSIVFPRILLTFCSTLRCKFSICLLTSNSIHCSHVSEEFIGMKIVGESMENNRINISPLNAMSQLGCINIATPSQIGLILIA